MVDSYLYIIVALLPLAAGMVILQDDPYHALVIRGLLGAIAAMIYAVLGAADVALTEALVGTMLAITLYGVAVRSSLVMRVGVLDDSLTEADKQPAAQLLADFKGVARKYHLRLELIPYPDLYALKQALIEKEVHATCLECSQLEGQAIPESKHPYHTLIRVRRLYEILQTELASPVTSLAYITATDLGEKHG